MEPYEEGRLLRRTPPISGYYVLVFSRILSEIVAGVWDPKVSPRGTPFLRASKRHCRGFGALFFWEGLMEGKSEQTEKPHFLK